MPQLRRKPYVTLSVEQKQQICQRKAKNMQLSNLELAKEYGVGKTTIQNILAQSEKWLNININNPYHKQLRHRQPKWHKLEEALWLWTSTIIDNGYTLTGDAILAKARDYAQRLGINEFRGTDGWLTKYKKRHELREVVKHGEAGSGPCEDYLETEREKLRRELDEYNLDDIYNADETGLFWAMEPCRVISNRRLSGNKKNKNKVSILLTTNASGTDKLPPLLIYKYQTPRPLRTINKAHLPVQ